MSRGGSGSIRRLPVVIAALLAIACAGSSSNSQLLGLEGRDREALDATYPPGTPRSVIQAREAEALVFSIHSCEVDGKEADTTLAAAVEAFEAEHSTPPSHCDRVRLARTGWVTLVGGLAYYQDYVFYDADERVLASYRTFIQRSSH